MFELKQRSSLFELKMSEHSQHLTDSTTVYQAFIKLCTSHNKTITYMHDICTTSYKNN